MQTLSTGKNISIHFTDEELSLLEEFQEYRKKNYLTMSGWVKQNMHKTLRSHTKPQLAFR